LKTIIGKLLGDIRFDVGENQKQMAERLNKTPQFLSAIERGVKPISESFIKSIETEYKLPYSSILALSRARYEIMDNLSLNTEKLSQGQKQALISLFLQVDNLSQYDWEKINAIATRSERSKIATEQNKKRQ
jgi:transcriptional regulator with XRE-family HTH domain